MVCTLTWRTQYDEGPTLGQRARLKYAELRLKSDKFRETGDESSFPLRCRVKPSRMNHFKKKVSVQCLNPGPLTLGEAPSVEA